MIGRLRGKSEDTVIAGNHRDAWVRGAHDAGGGTVALLRAAQHLGERARGGFVPEKTITLAFWDAEESGLIGSTEWAEANAAWLTEHLITYVNADAAVSGTNFNASGTPGLEAALERALERVPMPPQGEGGTLRDGWLARGNGTPRIGLPGSGSDFAVFLHHLCLPVIDFGFSGNSGGQYHTSFDDFLMVDRHLDPGFVGHELAGQFVTEFLTELSSGAPVFDPERAAAEMAHHARAASDWLGAEAAEKLATAFEGLSVAAREHPPANPGHFYAELALEDGLPGRAWYRNGLWTPGIEKGYGADTFPTLREEATRADEVGRLIARIVNLRERWERK